MSFWSDLRSRFLGHDDSDAESYPDESTAEPQANGEAGDPPDEPAAAAIGSPGDDVPVGGGGEQGVEAVEDLSLGDATDVAPVGPEIDVAARQERAAGLILDDEGLRGDLTDDEFSPLQAWALAASDRVVEMTENPDDDAAFADIGKQVEAVKDVVRLAAEAVAAHVNGKDRQRAGALAALAELSASPALRAIVSDGSAAAIMDLSSELDADPTPGGQEVAELIMGALAGQDRLPGDPEAEGSVE